MADEDGQLSDPARRLIGGLCQYADSLTAFGNTVSSAYLRLVPNQEAPTRICWSDLNRSAMIRVPLGWTTCLTWPNCVNPQDTVPFQEAARPPDRRAPQPRRQRHHPSPSGRHRHGRRLGLPGG